MGLTRVKLILNDGKGKRQYFIVFSVVKKTKQSAPVDDIKKDETSDEIVDIDVKEQEKSDDVIEVQQQSEDKVTDKKENNQTEDVEEEDEGERPSTAVT